MHTADYPFEKSPTVLYGEMIDGELRAQAGLPDLRFFNAGFLFAHGGDAMVAGRAARGFETGSRGIASPVFDLYFR